MGIFDDIVDPIKGAFQSIVKGVEIPIHVVESLFGQVIHFTEELIHEFLNMIEDLRNLFNASNIETIFITPFKDAALDTVGDVRKLYALIVQASAPVADGVKDDLMVPINAVYSTMKSGMMDMTSKLGDLLAKIEEEGQKVAHSIWSDFNRVKASLEAFPVELGILKRKIVEEFKAVTADAFGVLPDVPEMLEHAGASAFHVVKKRGEVIGADFTNFEASAKKRFENENAVIDLFYIVMIGAVLVALVSIFMITKSMALIMTIVIMILVALVLHVVVEFILGEV